MFLWSDKRCEVLELLSGNVGCPVDDASLSLLDSQVQLEVGVEVFFEGLVADESHSADSAFKFDSFEDLILREDG
jgi:hypothetical protein